MASRTVRRRLAVRNINGNSGKRRRPLLTFALVVLVCFMMITSGASAATILFAGDNLPNFQNFKKSFQFQNTLIRADDGSVLYDMANVQANRGRRVVEPLEALGHPTSYYQSQHVDWLVGPDRAGIPVVLQNATIATEDASFYNNLGFDPFSMARAGYENIVRGHIVSGGSTITQQLVKQYLLGGSQAAQTLGRKTEEIVLAAQLTQKYPKSKILWYYLNSVPYGNISIGAEAAAGTYFHQHIWQLQDSEPGARDGKFSSSIRSLAKAAFLAGLPEAPSLYNPVNNLPAALNRMRYVLHLMYQHGYLVDAKGQPDPSLIRQAMAEAHTWPRFTPAVTIKRYPHFVQYAVDQLQNIASLRSRVYNGLDVVTSLDPQLQDTAQAIVHDQVAGLGMYAVTDGALVSIDLRPDCYGCIRAMVGSADYNDKSISGQINMANTPRQPGSSFKPFNYIYAFEHGMGPGTTVLDAPVALPDTGNPQDGGWYEPINYDHAFHGTVTLRVALANSLNIPAVKVEQANGVDNVKQMAMKMGIKSLMSDNPNCCGWSLTLGGLDRGVRLVEETSAFGVFAAQGKTVPPVAIVRVYDRGTHKLLYDAARDNPDGTARKAASIFDPAYAYVMNNVLSDNASRCTPQVCEFGTNSPLYLGRTAAAKTGTTNSFTDNWTVGYTPDIVTGVWVGNANSNPMIGTTGVTGAAPIWHDFMLAAFKRYALPPKDFAQPAGVYSGSSCRVPGPYTTYGAMPYDIYAGIVPLCTVGTSNTSLPVAPPNVPYQPPAHAPVTPAPYRSPYVAPPATARHGKNSNSNVPLIVATPGGAAAGPTRAP